MGNKSRGFADILIGLQDGDEGKAKATDAFNRYGLHLMQIKIRGQLRGISRKYNIGARGNGGSNAGHTIEFGGKRYKLRAIPSAAAVDNMQLYIGSGCVVNPTQILGEAEKLRANGLEVSNRLKISAAATTVTPIDVILDKLNGKEIGTTGNGIGQAYTNQAIRGDQFGITNLRIAEAAHMNPNRIRDMLLDRWHMIKEDMHSGRISDEKLKRLCSKVFEGETFTTKEAAIEKLDAYVRMDVGAYLDSIKTILGNGWIEEDLTWINSQLAAGRNVLVEGAQALGLSKSHGPIPFVTSSNTTPGSILEGADIHPTFLDLTGGIAKAIPSRVGNGNFPEEFGGAESEEYCANPDIKKPVEEALAKSHDLLRDTNPLRFSIGFRYELDEYGAATGRPRRVGMPNSERVAHACRLARVDFVFMTRVDSLQIFSETPITEGKIPVVTNLTRNGVTTTTRPITDEAMRELVPVIKLTPAFKGNIQNVRRMDDLPEAAKVFVRDFEERIGTPIAFVGNGPDRREMIRLY